MLNVKFYCSSFFLLILVALFLNSCNNRDGKEQRPLAVVYDKYLYKSDITDIFPKGMTKGDSVKVLNAYVDQWVRHNLMLRLSEEKLSDVQKDVNKQLEDYRSSLLIFKYEQEYILQRLDTAVSSDEIQSFYSSNISNFTLGETLVKALYIKVRKDTPYLSKIKELYQSNRDDDIKTLDNLAYQVADKYDYFYDKWLSFNTLQRQFPYSVENADDYLRSRRSIEMEDGNYSYLVNIRSVMYKGQISPLDYEIANIKSIIINKRKQKLINDLENKVYNDALNHKKFQTF
ncbi:MAG: hypothetical protein EHM93_01860 [Bacteroidales bacterium]|nr:MAG: hypothetical protein EHM93_01860 [Bacteroidales bacterium]